MGLLTDSLQNVHFAIRNHEAIFIVVVVLTSVVLFKRFPRRVRASAVFHRRASSQAKQHYPLRSLKLPLPPVIRVCHNILRAGEAAREVDLVSFLRSRAIPNQRLVRTFSIQNSFTTEDVQIHKNFLKQAKEVVAVSEADWMKHSGKIVTLIREKLAKCGHNFHLVRCIQGLTLGAILPMLFPEATFPEDCSVEVEEFAIRLNNMWRESKENPTNLTDTSPLYLQLRKLFPQSGFLLSRDVAHNIDQNPLNLILPAYETMWRVVLRTFLEVNYRSQTRYTDGMMSVAANPTLTSLRRKIDGTENITAESIVKESLRLYPPTRHVYRRVGRADGDLPTHSGDEVSCGGTDAVYADIEACHSQPEVWGPNPLQFRPGRWIVVQDRFSDADIFLSFGVAPNACPARPVFANMFVAIMVGRLCEVFQAGWDVRGPVGQVQGVLDRAQKLTNGRCDYSEIYLERV